MSRMMCRIQGAAAVAALGVVMSGCVPLAEGGSSATRTVVTGHEGGAYTPRNTNRYNLEDKERFVLLDKAAERAITCSGIQERILEDGRLELSVNVRNRLNRRVEFQINCIFKDEQGFPTGDETPFQALILTENAQEGVRFASMNNKAKRYTIRVREAR